MASDTKKITGSVTAKLNGFTSRNPMDAIKVVIGSKEIEPIEIFKAWPLTYSVMAERIRKAGLNINFERIREIMEFGVMTEMENYMLKILSLEIRNDIDKIKI